MIYVGFQVACCTVTVGFLVVGSSFSGQGHRIVGSGFVHELNGIGFLVVVFKVLGKP